MLYPLSYGGPARQGHGNCSKDGSTILLGVWGRLIRSIGRVSVALIGAAVLFGCVPQAPPAPAQVRTVAPPWPAPRDAISQFELAEVELSRLDDTTNQRIFRLSIRIDGRPVEVAPNIGIDRVRAVQAPVHTHDTSGTVWLEGAGADTVTLGQFFLVWGVRFDQRCLGAACGAITVTADGLPVGDPAAQRLAEIQETLSIEVQTQR